MAQLPDWSSRAHSGDRLESLDVSELEEAVAVRTTLGQRLSSRLIFSQSSNLEESSWPVHV
jgi:hypothetical protein